MNDEKRKNLLLFAYSFAIGFICIFFLWLGSFQVFQDFIAKIEQNSFDMRQVIASKIKSQNNNIVVLGVDDPSYEYIMDKFGEWPISRKIWANTIELLEMADAKAIVFDLLFLKPNLNDVASDSALVNVVKKYNNVYFSMNFDNYENAVRTPPAISPKFKAKVKSGALPDDCKYTSFKNARVVMDELSFATKNIGAINVERDNDGVIRKFAPLFKYQGNYYPSLSLRVAMDLLNVKDIEIDKTKIILDDKHIIPIDESNRAILNWYSEENSNKHISFYNMLIAQKNHNAKFFKDNFKNKIVFIGTTATSMSDVKSSPISSQISGVDFHTTFLNNIFDHNFIKKSPLKVDFLVAVFLSFLIGYFVLANESIVKSFAVLFLMLIFYGIYTLVAMLWFDLWISVVFPYLTVVSTFVLVYCLKYLLKSKDYEQTYKLAVTDGLTQLYNHRFFQEQLAMNTDNFRRYGSVFSIIMIDIDFFKKFNDTYGHQSGDCVLKQVAKILKNNSRSTDLACRYGGEEMTLILNNTNKKEAVITAQKICQTVRDTLFVLANGEKVHVTISVGVATAGLNGLKPKDIIEYADKCLYIAKENGRNQVVYKPIKPKKD